ncbi:MAG: gcvT, partial [Rhodospirillales bacterium]|nr:gcvT [Rhodospirillales bacterium]
MTGLRETALHALHVSLGAKMVPFAGYSMPVQYPSGILAEHRHTRTEAGLFDVGHMGQARIHGGAAVRAIEALVPGDIQGLEIDHTRYTQLTNDAGGILDDLMVTRRDGHLFLVVNAACKEDDYAHIAAALPKECRLEVLDDRALIALQGPAAIAVMDGLCPGIAKLGFMSVGPFKIGGIDCLVSRSGYTGEDGVEISAPNAQAEALAQTLLRDVRVKPAGLGARDTLRLEAGLCLYGHDIDTTTTPVEAALTWSIGKRRRLEGGFAGATVIQKQLAEGPARKRVGILPEGRVPVRDGADIADASGAVLGKITSGGFGPTVDRPIAMGYVRAASAAEGMDLAV